MRNEIDKREEAYRTLDRINFWISNCDSKASFILAFLGIFFPLVLTNQVTIDSVKSAVHTVNNLTISSGIVLLLSTVLLILMIYLLCEGLFYIINSLKASINTDTFSHNKGLSKVSIYFFGSIASRGFMEFVERIDKVSEEEVLNDLHSQVYINSCICNKKFIYYNKAVSSTRKALVVFLFLVLIYVVSLLI